MKVNGNCKVAVASMFGMGSPISSAFFETTEPVLKLLLLVGQIGVAVVTILYIYRKGNKP